jgi:hypothetical protein
MARRDLVLVAAGATSGVLLTWLYTYYARRAEPKGEDVRAGVPGLIGQTPLVRIKSLSDLTGCEILVRLRHGALPSKLRSRQGKCEVSLAPAFQWKGLIRPVHEPWRIRKLLTESLCHAKTTCRSKIGSPFRVGAFLPSDPPEGLSTVIEQAERDGLLLPRTGSCIFEGTVGSTGISIATVARAKGYLAAIILPDDVKPILRLVNAAQCTTRLLQRKRKPSKS